MEKARSSLASISINSCIELSKTQFFLWVSLKRFKRCSSNVNFKSKVTPKCFCELVWDTIALLKTIWV